jgi:hypothetical protein
MSTDFNTLERFHGDEDQYIRAEQISRRLSVIEIAEVNASLASRFNTTPHILNSVIDMNDHFNPKDYMNMAGQRPIVVTDQVKQDADKVMQPDQLGLHEELEPTHNEWELAFEELAKNVDTNAVDTSDDDIVAARRNVEAMQGEATITAQDEQWLAAQILENA